MGHERPHKNNSGNLNLSLYSLLSREPRHANSTECGDESTCLCGDDCCYQKVVYFTFQQSQGEDATTGEEIWTSFQQPLNVSCECQVLNPSTMMTYFSYYDFWFSYKSF